MSSRLILSDAEIERRMNDAVRRALSTPPTPAKELIGKSERAKAKRGRQIKKPLGLRDEYDADALRAVAKRSKDGSN